MGKDLSWNIEPQLVDEYHRKGRLGGLALPELPIRQGYDSHVSISSNLTSLYEHIVGHLNASSLSDAGVKSIILTNTQNPISDFYGPYVDRISLPQALDIGVITKDRMMSESNISVTERDSGVTTCTRELLPVDKIKRFLREVSHKLFLNRRLPQDGKMPINLQFFSEEEFIGSFQRNQNLDSLDAYGIPFIGQNEHFELITSAGKVKEEMKIGYIAELQHWMPLEREGLHIWVHLPEGGGGFGRRERRELGLGKRQIDL